MKKFVPLVALLFILPSYATGWNDGARQEQQISISFAIDTKGSGYSIPAGITFIMGRHIVLWYYEDGYTKSFIPDFEVNGKQVGVGVLLLGIWKAPTMFQQPGEITGVGVGIVVIFANYSY